jgi:hypothetical protein
MLPRNNYSLSKRWHRVYIVLMDKIRRQIEWLIKKHGGLTKAANATGIAVSYLCLLRHGKRLCRDPTLKKLGLERRVIIRRIK